MYKHESLLKSTEAQQVVTVTKTSVSFAITSIIICKQFFLIFLHFFLSSFKCAAPKFDRLHPLFFYLFLHFKGFIMLHFCPSQLRAQLGTTPNIKHIVVGRCYTYTTLVNPSLR